MQEVLSSIHSQPRHRAAPIAIVARRTEREHDPEANRSLYEEILHDIPASPTDVRQAFEILTTVSQRLRDRGDARAVFPDIYAVVTRRVRDSIHGPAEPLFYEPAFISRLAGRFCELYLAALRRALSGEPERIDAWAMADRAKDSADVLPIQHAMLGLNAHINFDLALGLFANVIALGDGEGQMLRYRHDHDAVNQILREALPEVIELLATRYGCPVSRLLARTGRLSAPIYEAALVTLTVWRTRVWSDLVALLDARGPMTRARIESRMNLRAGIVARLLDLLSFPLHARRSAPTLGRLPAGRGGADASLPAAA